jgi:hypothetical protein
MLNGMADLVEPASPGGAGWACPRFLLRGRGGSGVQGAPEARRAQRDATLEA